MSRLTQFYNPISLDNGSTLRDVYPTATGQTTDQLATGPASGAAGAGPRAGSMENDEVAQAARLGGQVSPVIGGIVFIAMVFGLMFLAKRLGTSDGDFSNLKPSVYNVVTIAFAAAAGLPLLKYAAVKLKVPGITNWILAA